VLCVTLFAFGSPEWGPLVSGFLGLLLVGAAFIAVGLVIASLSTGAVAGGLVTFALALVTEAAATFRYLGVGDVLGDFAKGIVDTGNVISCVLAVAVGVCLARQTMVRAAADGSNRFHAGVAWLGTVLAAALAAFVAIHLLPAAFGPRWDATATRVYTLSSDTRAALRSLDAPVHIRVRADTARESAFRDRLKEYAEASTFIRVDQQPDAADSGAAVMEYRGRTERVKTTSEQDLTNALVSLREGSTRKILSRRTTTRWKARRRS